MNTTTEKTIGEMVAEDYRTAQVFRKFGLDFCCGGGKSVEEACHDKGVEFKAVRSALQELGTTEQTGDNYNEWSLDFLVDYIVNNHHKYARNKLPEIGQYANKVAKVHGERHPELVEIYYEFTKMHGEITNHLDKEEELLFPYIKEMVRAEQNGKSPQKPDYGSAVNPISMMEQEHDDAGEAMAKIRELSSDFTPPEDACTTYRILFENLEAFEKDLHKHVHLENNILFPKAIELEKRLY